MSSFAKKPERDLLEPEPYPRIWHGPAEEELQFVKEAAEEVVYAWEQYVKSSTVVEQAHWVNELSNKISDLRSWAPVRYDSE